MQLPLQPRRICTHVLSLGILEAKHRTKKIMRHEEQFQGSAAPDWRVGRMETDRAVFEYLEKLEPLLRADANILRDKGFPVDERCRINPAEFGGGSEPVFSETSIARDRQLVKARKEGKFERGTETTDAMGELLESTATIAFNELWFGGRLVKVRTAEYDDYIGGVDEFIVDTQTQEIIAAIDTTTVPDLKALALRNNVNKGGAVKYGVAMDARGARKTDLANLPYLVLSIPPKDLLPLARVLVERKGAPQARELEARVLAQLIKETDVFATEVADAAHRGQYRRLRAIFEEIQAVRARPERVH